MRSKGILLCLGLVLAVFSVKGAVLHVRQAAAGPETNGLSWATAFNTITQALKHASNGDELWVAAGTYKGPIQVPAGVALFGGFAGDETARTQRDWARHRTIIDWDDWDYYPEQYWRPKSAVSLADGSRLDGVTVINGWHSHGAGVYAGKTGATIANNIIVTNRATGILGSALFVDHPGEFDVDDDFFLRTATDLLRLQFPFGATNIPVASYGPAVHRLLQVAANIYDGARSNFFPSVFRPQFASTPDGVVISGYYQDDSAATVHAWLSTNPYGIPMIIGARKGFPNFNELAIQTAVLVARRLELRRRDTNSSPYQTNEMYVIGISNFVAVEAWNSYTQTFGHELQIRMGNVLSYALTSGGALVHRAQVVNSVLSNLPAGSWAGFRFPQNPTHPANAASFRIPLFTTNMSNFVYRFGPPEFLEALNPVFETGAGFRVPDWQLTISNRLTFLLSSGERIVDFVSLHNLTNTLRLSEALFGQPPNILEPSVLMQCWSTNRPSESVHVPTQGIQTQMDISLEPGLVSQSEWRDFNFQPSPDRDAAIQNFWEFVFHPPSSGNINLLQIAPFSPARKFVISANWQANDPLVHALPEHLKDVTNNFITTFVRPFRSVSPTNSLGMLNFRYAPWGGRPNHPWRPEDVYSAIRDPALWSSDHFDFPSGPDVNVHWLDRIHRGTPWQTLYFDQEAAPVATWTRQSLDPLTHPTNDWKIIEYLRNQLVYSGAPAPARVLNNTIVGNSGGGVLIGTNASASVMNNVVAFNTSGLVDEGGEVDFSRNCTFGNATHNTGDLNASPQFAPGQFSVVATSPLIDAGDDAALAWIERPVLGRGIDIGALEFGPDGVPVLAFDRTSQSLYELELRGFAGQTYVIEATTNLVDWISIATNTATLGSVLFQDAAATNHSHRFYRAKTLN